MTSQESSRRLLNTVEGPKGKATMYEVVRPGSERPEYEVESSGKTESYPTMGEAYLEAKSITGATS